MCSHGLNDAEFLRAVLGFLKSSLIYPLKYYYFSIYPEPHSRVYSTSKLASSDAQMSSIDAQNRIN